MKRWVFNHSPFSECGKMDNTLVVNLWDGLVLVESWSTRLKVLCLTPMNVGDDAILL